MTYTSFSFFLFLLVTAAVYFLIPLRYRWIVLLTASLGLYGFIALPALPILILEAMISFAGGFVLDRSRSAEKGQGAGKRVFFAVLLSVIIYLAVVKLVLYLRPGTSMLVPVGLSYFSFSNISYLLDVYWKRNEAERNPAKYLLFVSFFPHILQGPIPRYGKLMPQLLEGHPFVYKRVTFGLQLMLYGLFQKLVLADRLAIYVDAVFADYENQYGFVMLAAIFFYAIQIYMDFAGCVNISRGVAELFGIELEENFQQPYFATSVEEYWRRWHITLGAFFRDYVGMPVSTSKVVKKWSRTMREKHGRDAGRLTVTLTALAAVWPCTGFWHGTGLSYLLWALWQGGIIALSQIFKKQLNGMTEALHLTDRSVPFHLFRILRTFVLAGIIPRVVTRAPSVRAAFVIMKHCVSNTGMAQFHLGGGLEQFGWSRIHLEIALIAMLVQLIVSILKERGVSVRQGVASFVLPLRWLIYLALLFAVVLFGIYGPGYDARAFVYMDF